MDLEQTAAADPGHYGHPDSTPCQPRAAELGVRPKRRTPSAERLSSFGGLLCTAGDGEASRDHSRLRH
jgi:hypothetical protein